MTSLSHPPAFCPGWLGCAVRLQERGPTMQLGGTRVDEGRLRYAWRRSTYAPSIRIRF
jgi:hypothetical protein